MAITENDGIVQIIATGGESEIDFDFKLLVRSDLRVLRNDTELTLDLHYTIPDESLIDDSGGSIALDDVTYFPDGATAGDIFTLILDPPCEREGDFQPGDGITRWQTHNSEYDRIWQYLQKLTRIVSRAALIDETELGLNLLLPLPEDGSFIGWDGTEGAMTNFSLSDELKGAPGDNASIAIGTVTTLSPGASATVENVGTETSAVLNFGIPAGEDGDGSGDVSGPETNTADYLPQWDGANSKTLKNGQPVSATPGNSTVPISNASGKLDEWLSDASETVKGKVEFATTAEAVTGESEALAVHPAGVAAAIDARHLYAKYQHTASSGDPGGTATSGSWRTIPITSEIVDDIGGSLSSDLITLPKGRYEVEFSHVFFYTEESIARLVTTPTGGTTSYHYSEVENSYGGASSLVEGKAVVDFVGTNGGTLAWQYRVASSRSSDGLGPGASFGVTNIFGSIEIRKIG